MKPIAAAIMMMAKVAVSIGSSSFVAGEVVIGESRLSVGDELTGEFVGEEVTGEFVGEEVTGELVGELGKHKDVSLSQYCPPPQ